MTIIDAHLHVNYQGVSVKDAVAYMDREHIDCCWLLSWEEVTPGHWLYRHLSVEDIHEAHQKYPSRFIPFYAPDPHRKDAAAQLENWARKGFRGCGELKATVNWSSEQTKSLLQAAQKLRMPVLFHMQEKAHRSSPDGKWDRRIVGAVTGSRPIYRIPHHALRLLAGGLPPVKRWVNSYDFPGYMQDFASLESALRDFPGVNFVAHGPMFWKHIAADAARCKTVLPEGPFAGEGVIWRLLRDYPNLYADLSASGFLVLARDPANAQRFLSTFEDKLLYGTDNIFKEQRTFLESLRLSQGAYRKIYGENACRLVHL